MAWARRIAAWLRDWSDALQRRGERRRALERAKFKIGDQVRIGERPETFAVANMALIGGEAVYALVDEISGRTVPLASEGILSRAGLPPLAGPTGARPAY